jgi:DHA1 family multidrug resistance protein-like MFS transporter
LVSWKKNLVVIWISQFLSIAGFSFAMPFAPYFLQELGVTDPDRLKIWVAAFAAAAPLSLALFSPMWGRAADIFGRRLMLLRANLGAAILLTLMSTVVSPAQLVGLRLLQGLLTGTMTAAQTLVAVHTPHHRRGFALGALGSALYCGYAAGGACGGIVADLYGYRIAFLVAGAIIVLAAIVVLFGTSDTAIEPSADRNEPRTRPGRAELRLVWPLLGVLGFLAFARHFGGDFLTLLVQDIHGSDGVSRWMGLLLALTGVAGFMSGFSLGHLSDKIGPVKVAVAASVLGGLLMIPQAMAGSFLVLFPARFGSAFCLAGLEPVFQAWISRKTPQKYRGSIFGWCGSIRAIGWLLSPIIGGCVAWFWSIRGTFFVCSAVIFMLAPIVIIANRAFKPLETARANQAFRKGLSERESGS